jgi:hypothetical protein
MKNDYSIAFSLRLNRLPVPKTAGLKWEPYLTGVQYEPAIAQRL